MYIHYMYYWKSYIVHVLSMHTVPECMEPIKYTSLRMTTISIVDINVYDCNNKLQLFQHFFHVLSVDSVLTCFQSLDLQTAHFYSSYCPFALQFFCPNNSLGQRLLLWRSMAHTLTLHCATASWGTPWYFLLVCNEGGKWSL